MARTMNSISAPECRIILARGVFSAFLSEFLKEHRCRTPITGASLGIMVNIHKFYDFRELYTIYPQNQAFCYFCRFAMFGPLVLPVLL